MRQIAIASGGEHHWPFSKGLVVESLMNAGIERETAMTIARRIEQRLLDEGLKVIDPTTLKHKMAEEVRLLLGESWATQFETQITAFEDIVVQDRDERFPFSKGILARSLELAGLSTREAYELAKTIERELRLGGISQIERGRLEGMVLVAVEQHAGIAVANAYRERWDRATQIGIIEESGVFMPYSKGIMAQSLMATGLSPHESHRMAREIEVQLFERGQPLVKRQQLYTIAEGILQSELGDDIANRYRLLRSLRRPNKPIHILIGGVTGTGKSFLAAEIAYRLGITRIESTDSVRQVMRAMVSRELLPALHASTFDAWTTILEPHEAKSILAAGKPEAAQVIEGFRDQVAQVTVGVRALIERASQEHTSLIVEGVHIVPGYLPTEAFKDAIVVPMLVVVRSEEDHRQRFYLRDQETQQHRPMSRYLEHFDSIRALQEYVEGMAKAVGVPIIDAEGVDRAAEAAVEVVAQKVLSIYNTISDI
jgi:2-phosphoglycerate kinase